jgi:hypothetical protein
MELTEWGQHLLTGDLPEITTACICTKWDETKDEPTDDPADDCYGCWDDQLSIFAEDTAELRQISPTWRVDGLPLWNRTVSGSITVKVVSDLIRGITVNGEWSLRYKVTPTHLWCYLSHHDASGSFIAYPYVEVDVE